jgi:hypothetical protein
MPAGLGSKMIGVDFLPPPPPPSSGQLLWLNGRNGITAPGGNVTLWSDQSGNGTNYSQVNGAPFNPTLGAINGKTALAFNPASSQTLNAATGNNVLGASAWTIFAVWKYTGAVVYSAGNAVVSMPAFLYVSTNNIFATAIGAAVDGSVGTEVHAFTGASYAVGDTATTDAVGLLANAHQSYHAYDGSHAYCSIDGGAATTAAGAGTPQATSAGYLSGGPISGNQVWSGLIGEILAYNSFLGPTEVAAIQAYLKYAWSL